MADSEKNLKVVKTKKIHEEIQEELFQELIELILPKVKPMIKPATARFKAYLKGEGEKPVIGGRKMLIDIVDGEVHLFTLKGADIEAFEMKEGSEPEEIYKMEEFIQMILSGQFK